MTELGRCCCRLADAAATSGVDVSSAECWLARLVWTRVLLTLIGMPLGVADGALAWARVLPSAALTWHRFEREFCYVNAGRCAVVLAPRQRSPHMDRRSACF